MERCTWIIVYTVLNLCWLQAVLSLSLTANSNLLGRILQQDYTCQPSCHPEHMCLLVRVSFGTFSPQCHRLPSKVDEVHGWAAKIFPIGDMYRPTAFQPPQYSLNNAVWRPAAKVVVVKNTLQTAIQKALFEYLRQRMYGHADVPTPHITAAVTTVTTRKPEIRTIKSTTPSPLPGQYNEKCVPCNPDTDCGPGLYCYFSPQCARQICQPL